MQKYIILIMALIILVAVFVILNPGKVALNLIFTKFEVSLALVMLVSFFFGILLMLIVGGIEKLKVHSKIKEFEKQIADKDKLLITQRKQIDELTYRKEDTDAKTPEEHLERN